MPVHPHVGGEHDSRCFCGGKTGGSSPRGWGTRDLIVLGDHRLRFIPTWVGNTSWGISNSSKPSVHPHVGGEHRCLHISLTNQGGSSPRGWGTPACKTCSPFRPSVHPHVGGEHYVVGRLLSPLRGSSPRGWGTLRLRQRGYLVFRFIPTWVGNTQSQAAVSGRIFGSSPRGWGTRRFVWNLSS